MLRYARHYGLSQTPSYNIVDLLQGCRVSEPQQSSLLQHPEDEADFALPTISREQFGINREALSFLQSVIRERRAPPVVELPKRSEVTIEYPLESRKHLTHSFYQVPANAQEVVAAVKSYSISDEPPSVEDFFKSISESTSKFVNEILPVDSDCGKLIQASTSISNNDSAVCRWPEVIEPPDYHLEEPLLPIARISADVIACLTPNLSDCLLSETNDIFAKEAMAMVYEELEGSAEYVDNLLSESVKPHVIASMEIASVVEFEMPLTPRPSISHAISGLQDASNIHSPLKDVPMFSSDMISPTEEIRNLSSHDQDLMQSLMAKDQLIVCDAKLKIPEPAVQPFPGTPDLTQYPQMPLDLLEGSAYSDFVVRPLAMGDLDLRMSWNPFGKVLPEINFGDQLPGEAIVDDYLLPLPRASNIADQASPARTTRGMHEDQATSPLSVRLLPTHDRCRNPDRVDSAAEYVVDSLSTESATCTGLDKSSWVAAQLELLDRTASAPAAALELPQTTFEEYESFSNVRTIALESSDALNNESTPSPTPCNRILKRKRDDVEFDPQHYGGDPIEQERTADIAEMSAFIDSSSVDRPSSNDSLMQAVCKRIGSEELLKTKRRSSSVFNVSANVARHMRAEGRQVSEPRSSSPVLTEPIALDMSEVIAPQLSVQCEMQQWWIISTSLLAKADLSRPLRRHNANVTFIERDLPGMTEVGLILTPTTGLILMRLAHLLDLQPEYISPAQERIVNLSRKYSVILLMVMYETLDEDQVARMAAFQGWASRMVVLHTVFVRAEEETQQYLNHLARTYGSQGESLQSEESWTETVLCKCPFINAMSAQMIARRTSLYDFLQSLEADKLGLLRHVGLAENQCLAIARYFE